MCRYAAVMEDTLEDARADAIAAKLGYAKVGIIFNITTIKERAYTLSAFEVGAPVHAPLPRTHS